MSKIKKIMVAVDFSEYTPQVVDYAGRLAEDLTAELIFVNARCRSSVFVKKTTENDTENRNGSNTSILHELENNN